MRRVRGALGPFLIYSTKPWGLRPTLALARVFAQESEVLQRIDPGVVAVIKFDAVGVIADGPHIHGPGRLGLFDVQDV